MARREDRLAKIRAAKAALEQEAREEAAHQRAEAEAKMAARAEQAAQTGKHVGGRAPAVPDPATATDGPQSSPAGPGSRRRSPKRRLNPIFVSWLMNFPLFWTLIPWTKTAGNHSRR